MMKKSDIALFCLMVVFVVMYIVLPFWGINVIGVKVSLNIALGTFFLGFWLGGILKKLDLQAEKTEWEKKYGNTTGQTGP